MPDQLEDDLIYLSVFGIMDPLKPSVVESIRTCKKAGIQVVMCTGDNLETAKAIAIDAGIIPKEQNNLGSQDIKERNRFG